MSYPKTEKTKRFVFDYPTKGNVFDKDRLCFAKYPDQVESLLDFIALLLFRPITYEQMDWHSDKEIIDPRERYNV